MPKKIVSVMLWMMFVGYMLIMVTLLLRPDLLLAGGMGVRPVSLVPFATIKKYMSVRDWDWMRGIAVENLVGNVMVFVPLGLFLGAFRRPKRVWTSLLIVLVVPVAVECLQYVFSVGACDVDDVILNFLGGVIGVALYQLVRWLAKEAERARAVTAVVLVMLGMMLLVYISR